MKMPGKIMENWMAPCGNNCYVCYVHLRTKKQCLGCRGEEIDKPNHCRNCKIYACAKAHQLKYCGVCSEFPCLLINRMDKSYRQRYNVSLIENANIINTKGINSFLENEVKKWTCSECGGIISLHDGFCSECKAISQKTPNI